MKREKLKKILKGKCVTDEACETAIEELLNLHSAMSCYEFEGEAEEFWQETPDLITVENNGVKIWTDNDSEFKLKEGEKYTVKIYKA